MRRILGTLLLTLALTSLSACSGDDQTASDPTPAPTSAPTSADTSSSEATTPPETGGGEEGGTGGSVDFDAELVSGTAAGGTPGELLTAVGTDGELDAFLKQFRTPTFPDDVRSAVEAARGAGAGDVYAAIVGLGCDVPPGVEVTEGEAGYAVSALKVEDPLPECLAAVTTVAVVTIVA
ncbi:hypothetical protein BH11ACT8_BH11ACT8_14600 [soil metagenome]